jgi:hypothetical protein
MRTETRLMPVAGGVSPFDLPVDWARHNAGITPSFFIRTEPKLDGDGNFILYATGKIAEHVLECVRISIAGDCYTEAVQPVDDVIKERFALQYDAWKRGDESPSGTRLTDWNQPGMTARMIRDLEDLHIRSVEDLASISEGSGVGENAPRSQARELLENTGVVMKSAKAKKGQRPSVPRGPLINQTPAPDA